MAAPEIAEQQVAGARGALMKPFQSRRPLAQIERKRPAAKDDLGLAEQAIAFLPRACAGRARRQIAHHGDGGPGLANFAVKPASGVGQCDGGIDGLDLRAILSADALDGQDVELLHGDLPNRSRGTSELLASIDSGQFGPRVNGPIAITWQSLSCLAQSASAALTALASL